jgi:hypothetical protein
VRRLNRYGYRLVKTVRRQTKFSRAIKAPHPLTTGRKPRQLARDAPVRSAMLGSAFS